MERLTKRDENGFVECEIRIPLEFELGCNQDCKNCDVDRVLEVLCKYEDEAEQREKGCNMCTRITPDTPDMPDICRMDTLHILWCDYAGEIHDLSDEPAKYCPFCGRKLRDNDGDMQYDKE